MTNVAHTTIMRRVFNMDGNYAVILVMEKKFVTIHLKIQGNKMKTALITF